MKKVFKMILYLFSGLLAVLACLIIFLFVYYSFLENKQKAIAKELEKRSMVTKVLDGDASSFVRLNLNLIPVPKKVTFSDGTFDFPETLVFSAADSIKSKVVDFLKIIPDIKSRYSAGGENIEFIFNKSIPVQGYTMDLKPGKVIVGYSNPQGLYYSIVSLKVLRQNYAGKIPCVHIEDSPDLEVRGLMLDISRNKVPTLETLLNMTQLLADLKFNHLELYVEGFSFAYPSFKNLWEGKETPVTGEEIRTLDAFCRSHFIDLVPNQNSFGHMASWLATEQYKDLAECPKGYKMLGLISAKTTIDPSDPRSIELVTQMTNDLLPDFTSSSFNFNLDEPFELGKGKSKELCAKKGEGAVYLEFADKIHDLAVSKNKKMLMWGDIVLRHPELIPKVPKDITLLDWGYEASYPYERHCKVLQASGLNFMVCPGTNSWTSITGRTDNMLATIESATTNGVKYGAKGMLLTDWGDMGHWQYQPVSYAGYVAGAALSWNSSSKKEMDLGKFLSSYVFRDQNSVMGDLVLDLGRYNRYEEIPIMNMTTTMLSLQFGLRDKLMLNAIYDKVMKGIVDLLKDLSPEMTTFFSEGYENRHSFDYKGLDIFIDSKEELLQKTSMKGPDSILIKDEYLNAIRLIRFGAELQNYVDFRGSLNLSEEKSKLQGMKELGSKYLTENKRLWMLRNKSGGYDTSVLALNTLIGQIDSRIQMLNKSGFSRGINRFLEKIGTAGAVIYLNKAS